jgi:hypothetical protein
LANSEKFSNFALYIKFANYGRVDLVASTGEATMAEKKTDAEIEEDELKEIQDRPIYSHDDDDTDDIADALTDEDKAEIEEEKRLDDEDIAEEEAEKDEYDIDDDD